LPAHLRAALELAGELVKIEPAIFVSAHGCPPAGRVATLGVDLAAALKSKDVGLTLRVADDGVFPGGAGGRPEDDVAYLESRGLQLACPTTTEEVDDGQKDDSAQQRN
jgi:hypothetical protein